MKNTGAAYFVDQIVVVVLSYETFMKPLDFLFGGHKKKGMHHLHTIEKN